MRHRKIDAARIGRLGISGPAILWTSRMGICMAGNQGQFKNLSQEYFQISGAPSAGNSIIVVKIGFTNSFAQLEPETVFCVE
jgi:hypothetical protein